MSKKPTTKKAPKPRLTLKDLATQLGEQRRRMDEMDSGLAALRLRLCGLDERTESMSRDVGALTKRANGVDQVLTANAESHRRDVSRLSEAIGKLDTRQLCHANMITALERSVDALKADLANMGAAVVKLASTTGKDAQPGQTCEDRITHVAESISRLIKAIDHLAYLKLSLSHLQESL